ncbi:Xanthine/uracil/thiamine/ascorbate permease family protein [hydrothermal vent metagenome]|uniref:Xanthine/uracil/thiamine/ascorbate permease family protein n=1 Tax=hydrothermal vent metagenome TaxID=652676 RepID=A0A1W1EEW4_9ZZZZ
MLEKFFGSYDLKTEFTAGMSVFLAMIYIVPLNALILSEAGMPYEAVVTATALITILATASNALYAKTPIALSVGMGLNAYFTFGLVKGLGMTWQSALGVVFMSGVIFIILSLSPFRRIALSSIPIDIRRSISAGIGAFLAFIALKQIGIVVQDPVTFVKIGDLSNPSVLLGLGVTLLIFILHANKVKGALVISILTGAIVAWATGLSEIPDSLFSMPASIAPIAFQLDFGAFTTLAVIPVVIAFLVTDVFDSVGTLTGVGSKIFDDTEKLENTLKVDAVFSSVGALFGLSTVTAFVESAVGVEEGGRTGLSTLITAMFFVLTLFMLPLFVSINPNAIYPVLIVVGIFMFSDVAKIDFSDFATSSSAFLTITMIPFTTSIATGLALGMVNYVIIKAAKREFKDLNLELLFLTLFSSLILFV